MHEEHEGRVMTDLALLRVVTKFASQGHQSYQNLDIPKAHHGRSPRSTVIMAANA
jgi:hypothetical protein